MPDQQQEAIPGLARWGLKPGIVEAVQLWPGNGPQIWEWADSKPTYGTDGFVDGLAIYTKAGRVRANFGDWIIKHGPGNFGKLTAEEFAATFDPATIDAKPSRVESPAPAPAEPGALSTGALEPVSVAAALDREPLGRLVRETWVDTVLELIPDPKAGWVARWPELDDPFQREVDMRIGLAVASYALTENAATYGISCTDCAVHLDRANVERERAEHAEALLTEVEGACRDVPDRTDRATVLKRRILAIIGTGEGGRD